MLHVYHSNRLEALFILLCTLRESRPLADPLTPEKVLVANPGIGRWLNLQIADRAGIAANIDYVLPATFVWQLYRDCLDNVPGESVPEKSAFERNALRLRVLGELNAISAAGDDLWSPLQRYTSADGGTIGDIKRVQLASRIADVFDQYLVYRPQMLLDWEQGSDLTPGNDPAQRWQPALWRRLVESVNEPHRAVLWQRFCSLADRGEIDPALLPPQLHLFNVGLLPPSTLDVLVRLAKIDSSGNDRVSLYFLNPAIDYWADLLDMRRAARERLNLGAGVEPLSDDQIGNPLLSSLGGSGRTLMKLLGDRSEWVHDEQFFLPSASDNLLAAVQADLLHPFAAKDYSGQAEQNAAQSVSFANEQTADQTALQHPVQMPLLFQQQDAGQRSDQVLEHDTDQSTDQGALHPQANPEQHQKTLSANAAEDDSIQLHQCFSPMREVQALHDRLLDRFNADDTLTPADVIVMVPDINQYAPVIEAVFGSVGGNPNHSDRTRNIPWSIADRALVQVSQVVASVQRLFDLPAFEFEATAVLGFAAEPAIARRFGFDDNALQTISEWLRDSGVRRTLAGDDKKILRHSEAALHSWDFGLRRLLLGRAMPVGSGAVGDVLPSTQVDGQQAELLSQLLNLLQALADIQTQLGKPHTPSQWVDVINDMIAQLMLPDEAEADALAQLREMLIELDTSAISAGHSDAMTHAAFAEILRDELAGAQRKNHRYLTGRVTFSSMVPLRSVPFRIVCMLGLNDGDFPRQRPNSGFDLMAQHPLPGDRSVRDDDRYLFLEALLSARDELYLSWIYRSALDNSQREPSVLVSELRDYLDKHHLHQKPRCVAHPLQPFSASLFDSSLPALHTYGSEWAPPAEMPDIVTLNKIGSVSTPDTQISLDDFQRFWRNPSSWYCRRVLGIALWRDEHQPEDAEPFEVDTLSNYHLLSVGINLLMRQPDIEKADANAQLQRSGVLPHGGLGALAFSKIFDEAQTLVQLIKDHEAALMPVTDIDITVNGQQLLGQLSDVVKWSDGSVGLLHHHASALKGSHLSGLWLNHLIGSAAGALSGQSLLLAKDKGVYKARVVTAVSVEEASVKLLSWFKGFQIGQSSAVPYFAKTSAVLACAIKGNALGTWLPSSGPFGGPGESEEEAIQLLYSDTSELLNSDQVLYWAEQLMGDMRLKP